MILSCIKCSIKASLIGSFFCLWPTCFFILLPPKRSGITPNYVINGLIITTLPWSEGNRVRYDLLGRGM
ncbi:hypothetical protein EXT49_08725 [Pectobacterium polaris]|nr:hypothetical protein [Pectobacterium polaris]